MLWLSLDSIVRSLLLKEGKSSHYYLQYLTHATDAIKRLNTTTLKNVNSKLLPVTDYKAVILPCDYVDWVTVGMPIGENVRPLVYDSALNRLNNYDEAGTKIPYVVEQTDDLVTSGLDEVEEPYFGHDLSRDDYKFKVLPERNEIQLSADYPYDYIVLEYITDGLETDAATRIDPLAQAAIEKYILWQKEVHNRNSNDSERAQAERRFMNEWRLLRSAKSDLTKAEIIHAIRGSYSPLPKN